MAYDLYTGWITEGRTVKFRTRLTPWLFLPLHYWKTRACHRQAGPGYSSVWLGFFRSRYYHFSPFLRNHCSQQPGLCPCRPMGWEALLQWNRHSYRQNRAGEGTYWRRHAFGSLVKTLTMSIRSWLRCIKPSTPRAPMTPMRCWRTLIKPAPPIVDDLSCDASRQRAPLSDGAPACFRRLSARATHERAGRRNLQPGDRCAAQPFPGFLKITNKEKALSQLVLTDIKGRSLYETTLLLNTSISWETTSFLPHNISSLPCMGTSINSNGLSRCESRSSG